jgi:hypothetical protein
MGGDDRIGARIGVDGSGLGGSWGEVVEGVPGIEGRVDVVGDVRALESVAEDLTGVTDGGEESKKARDGAGGWGLEEGW